MARTYTDMLEYRASTDSGATWGNWLLLDNNASSPFTFPTALTTGKLYEFKITRSKPGNVTKVCDGTTDGAPNYFAVGTNTLTTGGSLLTTGTFTISTLTVTITRTKGSSPSLRLVFTGNNWTYVAVDYVSNGTQRKAAFNDGKTTSVTIGGNSYTVDATVIQEVSLKTIDVFLPSSTAFNLYIDYNGSSSGTLSVKSV